MSCLPSNHNKIHPQSTDRQWCKSCSSNKYWPVLCCRRHEVTSSSPILPARLADSLYLAHGKQEDKCEEQHCYYHLVVKLCQSYQCYLCLVEVNQAVSMLSMLSISCRSESSCINVIRNTLLTSLSTWHNITGYDDVVTGRCNLLQNVIITTFVSPRSSLVMSLIDLHSLCQKELNVLCWQCSGYISPILSSLSNSKLSSLT